MHSQARNVIERAFSILKNQFEFLKTAPLHSLIVQVAIIHACCILNIFIRQKGGYVFDNELHNEGTKIECMILVMMMNKVSSILYLFFP